jgi:lipoate-protein ligase B
MIPCGLEGVEMTSVEKETGRPCDMDPIKTHLTQLVRQYLGGPRP